MSHLKLFVALEQFQNIVFLNPLDKRGKYEGHEERLPSRNLKQKASILPLSTRAEKATSFCTTSGKWQSQALYLGGALAGKPSASEVERRIFVKPKKTYHVIFNWHGEIHHFYTKATRADIAGRNATQKLAKKLGKSTSYTRFFLHDGDRMLVREAKEKE